VGHSTPDSALVRTQNVHSSSGIHETFTFGESSCTLARHPFPDFRPLVQIKISNGFTGVWGFFGFLDRFLEFLFQEVSSVLLRLHRLAEDGFTAAVLLLHGSGSFFEIGEHFGFDCSGMSDDSLGRGIDLKHCAAARAGYIERRGILRHAPNDSANAPSMGLELDGKDMEDGQHFPTKENNRNDGYGDGQHLAELQVAPAGLKASRHQSENIQGSEPEDQYPEDVVDVVFFP